MNIDEMTLEQVRDYIAECKGWAKFENGEYWHEDDFPQWEHPLPATLDAAASSLPEGCQWCDITFCRNATIARCTDGRTIFVSDIEGDGSGKLEPLARFRAAAKAWQYVLAAKGGA